MDIYPFRGTRSLALYLDLIALIIINRRNRTRALIGPNPHKIVIPINKSQFENALQTSELSSIQFSHSVVSDTLRPHELQHARTPCPSTTLGVHSDTRPSSQWCHPAISSSVVPFFSCPQSLLASGSFPMSQLFAWGGQSTGVSASASFPPKKSQFLLDNKYIGNVCMVFILNSILDDCPGVFKIYF